MNAFLTPDPVLPQLAVAADAGLMRDIIAEHFGTSGEGTPCQLARIRYRRGQRAILQYSVGAGWVTVLVYPRNEVPRVWRKIQRHLADMPQLASHVIRLDDCGLILQRFPFDWNLPTLGAAIEQLPRRLRDVACMTVTQLQPVRYRAGLGAVLRCIAQPQDTNMFAKVFTDQDGERSFALLKQLQTHKSFRTPRPLAFFPDLNTLVLEAARGETLEQHLLRGNVSDAIQRVAYALAQLHLDEHLWLERRFTYADEATDLQRTGVYLREVCGDEDGSIANLVCAITDRMQPCDLRPAHRDLKPDHLFLSNDEDSILFIDVDSCAMADPVFDVALLIARLAALPYSLDISVADANNASSTLRNAYFARVPASWHKRLPVALASAFLNVASGFCRRLEFNRQMVARTMIAEAKSVAIR